MKKIINIIILCLINLFKFADIENQFIKSENPYQFPLNIDSEYEYENPPPICFFPLEKAKWNGYELRVEDWKKLTDYQKFCFLKEGINEIEKIYRIEINIKDNFLKFIDMLNKSSVSFEEKNFTDIPMLTSLMCLIKIHENIEMK